MILFFLAYFVQKRLREGGALARLLGPPACTQIDGIFINDPEPRRF